MSIDSIAGLLETLRQSRILAPAHLDQLDVLQPRFREPRALAKELLQRRWLTAYQINQLFQGKAAHLVLGQYVLLEWLGEGGMGQVFKARHQRLERTVALKVIRKDRLSHPDAIHRFQREARAAARLSHANIVTIHDADEVGGTHYFAMEYVEWTDLSQLVKQRGPLPVAQACAYIRQAAFGLQHAHEQGLVHRDIKPANLFLTAQGVVKILDMGLARLHHSGEEPGQQTEAMTQEGAVMGTPDFIAPEQAVDSHTADIRADLYSLGCTLYYLIAGKVPFAGGTLGEKLARQLAQDPRPLEELRPDVPPPVAAIVRKLMAKRPEQRYQKPAELAAALAAFAGGEGLASSGVSETIAYTPGPQAEQNTAGTGMTVVPPPPMATYPLARVPRPPGNVFKKHRRPIAGAGVFVVLAVLGYVVFFAGSNRVPPEQKQPETLTPTYTNSLGMEFVLVPKGKFLMGGGGGKVGDREVEIPHDFYLGRYEVTQGEWEAVTGVNPSYFSRSGGGRNEVANIKAKKLKKFPVEMVSWNDAQEFLKRLNERTKRTGWLYRLPKEAEWEYACRGGPLSTQLEYGYDYYLDRPTNLLLPDRANFDLEKGLKRTCKVGNYKPNRIGLYDMHGNVSEWCDDKVPRPNEPKGASHRWHRGGGWDYFGRDCQAAYRGKDEPSNRYNNLGLRLARVPVGKEGK